MHFRHTALAVALAGVLLAAPMTAAPAEAQISVPISGTWAAGTDAGTIPGTLQINRFVDQNGQVAAVGTLNATVLDAAGNIVRTIVQGALQIPVSALQAGEACEILHLELGPLHLDLLGLVVDLNQVVLDITAEPGPGNLLGNLLCSITGLLDQGGPVSQLVAFLNRLLGQL